MNWDQIKGDWHQLSRKLEGEVGQADRRRTKTIAGKRDQLEGVLHDRYGYTKDRAVMELDKFADAVSS